MNVTKDFRNELLKRKEINSSLEADKNPGIKNVQEDIAKRFKVENECVVIKKLWNNFGSSQFFAEAFVYDSVQDKESTEQKPKKKKEAAK